MKKNGRECKKMNRKGKKWFGTEINGSEGKKMNRNKKKWTGTRKNEPERKKMPFLLILSLHRWSPRNLKHLFPGT